MKILVDVCGGELGWTAIVIVVTVMGITLAGEDLLPACMKECFRSDEI